MGGLPPFAQGRNWYKRASKAIPRMNRKVWYDPDADFEYEREPNPTKHAWHQIDWRNRLYRDIDPDTGKPVAGSEGQWRPLK